MLPSFKGRVAGGTATPFALRFMACLRAMERATVLSTASSTSRPCSTAFQSPIDRGLPISTWGSEAKKMAPFLRDPTWAKDLECW